MTWHDGPLTVYPSPRTCSKLRHGIRRLSQSVPVVIVPRLIPMGYGGILNGAIGTPASWPHVCASGVCCADREPARSVFRSVWTLRDLLSPTSSFPCRRKMSGDACSAKCAEKTSICRREAHETKTGSDGSIWAHECEQCWRLLRCWTWLDQQSLVHCGNLSKVGLSGLTQQ